MLTFTPSTLRLFYLIRIFFFNLLKKKKTNKKKKVDVMWRVSGAGKKKRSVKWVGYIFFYILKKKRQIVAHRCCTKRGPGRVMGEATNLTLLSLSLRLGRGSVCKMRECFSIDIQFGYLLIVHCNILKILTYSRCPYTITFIWC